MKSLEKGIPQKASSWNNALKINLIKPLLVTILLGAGSVTAFGQNDPNGYGNNQNNGYNNNQNNGYNNNQNSYNSNQNKVTDESLIQAIAPYDEDVRNDILIATQYPDVLQKLSQIRDNTTRAFQATIQNYPQKKQSWFYELSRFPNLMDKLATMPRKQSKEEIESLLNNPTKELKEASWKLYNNHHDDLVTVNNLNRQAVNSFQDLINPLSHNAQNAFKTLQEMPDVLSLLNDHIDIASRLGERYTSDPTGVSQEIAQIHDHQEDQNKQDLATYKDNLAQNPQALQELNQASQDYASTGGYSYPAPTQDKVINYGSPYSYWFGYPMWYNSPMWYPGAFGYGSGIYFGLGGYSSIYGFPSLGFSRWFFGGAYRRYPNLYRQYGHYYNNYGSRYGYSAATRNPFMGSASRHFIPNISGRSNGFINNQAYRQSASRSYNVAPRQNYGGNINRSYGGSNSRSYSSPSYGGSRSMGGGVSRGYSGGGFHGGGGGSRGGRR